MVNWCAKTISNNAGNKESHSVGPQESYDKDVERFIGVLQPRFSIV